MPDLAISERYVGIPGRKPGQVWYPGRDWERHGKRAWVMRPLKHEFPTDDEVVEQIKLSGLLPKFADLTITTTSVTPGTGTPSITSAVLSTAMTAGQPAYLTAGQLAPANATAASGTSTTANMSGILLVGGSTSQLVPYLTSGNIVIGATLALSTAGGIYLLSALNAGKIGPFTDWTTSGTYLTIIGIATSTTNLLVSLNATGLTHV